jgi:hypothetical protein
LVSRIGSFIRTTDDTQDAMRSDAVVFALGV